MAYLINIAVCISQVFNTIAGGNPDQTVSARIYHNRHKPKWRTAYKFINRVFFWQDDHCHASAYTDYKNAQATIKKWS